MQVTGTKFLEQKARPMGRLWFKVKPTLSKKLINLCTQPGTTPMYKFYQDC